MKLPEPSAKGLEEELSAGIKLLQAKVQGVTKPDGIVSPSGDTILFLGGLRAQGKQIIADDAQMNYAMFFSSDGKAIHQSNAVAVTSFFKKWGVNYFGSHGCLRLAEADAAKLFTWAPTGTPVFPVFIDVSREAFQ